MSGTAVRRRRPHGAARQRTLEVRLALLTAAAREWSGQPLAPATSAQHAFASVHDRLCGSPTPLRPRVAHEHPFRITQKLESRG
jgi:hypothetical protein